MHESPMYLNVARLCMWWCLLFQALLVACWQQAPTQVNVDFQCLTMRIRIEALIKNEGDWKGKASTLHSALNRILIPKSLSQQPQVTAAEELWKAAPQIFQGPTSKYDALA